MAETSILFVDDERVIGASFTRELQVEHFAVTAVAGGGKAINALKNRQFDLVITDLMMLGVDGFEVLRTVQKLAPQTSVIVLTGNFDRGIVIEALRLGADDFALKPCEIEELVFRIGRCLEKRNLMQKLASQNQRSVEEINYRRLMELRLVQSENLLPGVGRLV